MAVAVDVAGRPEGAGQGVEDGGAAEIRDAQVFEGAGIPVGVSSDFGAAEDAGVDNRSVVEPV